MAVNYGKIRWVEEIKDIPKSAEFIVLTTGNYMVELRKHDSYGMNWILAQTTPEGMSERHYKKTLAEFRRIAQSNKTIWVVMPPWKFYKVHPELDISFD